MTAVMKLLKSSTDPILKLLIPAISLFLTAAARVEGIYALEAAEHFCPWNSNAPLSKAVATTSGSAEG